MIKIMHSADVQVNVAGKHLNRKLEYEHMLSKMANIVIDENYDMLILEGDLFERYNANETEKTLLASNLLLPLLAKGIYVVMTDGNHDLKQSSFTFDPGDGSEDEEINVLKSMYTQIAHENLYYFEDTGMYSMPTINGIDIIFAVWSHKSKYSNKQQSYNPWFELSQASQQAQTAFNNAQSTSVVIDLFHDPVKDAKNFDGNIVRGNNDGRVDIKEFRGDFACLGDIHLPQIFTDDERPNFFASYPSSPIVCYFGEGDYYLNDEVTQQSNNKHGFNEIIVNAKHDYSLTQRTLTQYTSRHTIRITKDFDVSNFKLAYTSAKCLVKIVLSNFEHFDMLDKLIKHLHANYSVVITTETPTNTYAPMTTDENFEIAELSTTEYVTKLALACVNDKLGTTDDSDEYKALLRERVMSVVEVMLTKINMQTPINTFEFLELVLTNFMPLEHCEIDFAKLKHKDSIAKINGNNGTGKTTIYKGLSWVSVGKIDWRQSDNKTKQNNLDYFNDKAWDNDIVTGQLKVKRQSDIICIDRKLERLWSAKVTDAEKQSKNWKHHVAKVVETLTVNVNDETLSGDKANELLAELFGGFSKFQDLHMVNQSSLDNMLLNMNINQLIDYILKNIGFTVSEQLKYPNIKEIASNVIFDGTVNHNKDVAGINVDINIVNAEIEDIDLQVEQITKLVDDNVIKLSEQNRLIATENAKIKVVDNTIDVSTEQQILDNQLAKQTLLKDIQHKIDNPEWDDAKESTLQELLKLVDTSVENVNAKSLDISKVQSTITELNSQIKLIEANKATKKSEFEATLLTKKNEALNTVNEVTAQRNAKIEELKTAVNAHINETSTELTTTRNKTYEKLDVEKAKVSQINEALRVADTKIDNLNESLTQYTGSCSICDMSYTDLPTVNTKIASINEDIAKLESTKKLLSDAATGHDKTIAELTIEVDKVDKDIESLRNIQPTEYVEYAANNLPEVHNTIYTEILNLSDKLKSAQENVDSINSNSQLSDTQLSELQVFDNDVRKLNDTIATKTTDLLNEQQELVKLQSAVTNNRVSLSAMQQEKESMNVVELYKRKDVVNTELNTINDNLAKLLQAKADIAENTKIETLVNELTVTLKSIESEIKTHNGNLAKLQLTKGTKQAKLQTLKDMIEDIKNYEVARNVQSLYNHLISNKGLNKYVFDNISMQINAELNKLLDGLNFRIFFDIYDGYTLKMVDLLGQQSVRNLYTIGGMESTLGALSLVTIMKSKTINCNGDFMFIDEITGKLNDSTTTKGSDATNKDYHQAFFQILKKLSTYTNIAIIDHVIPIEWFRNVINVVKYDNGKSTLV